VSGGTNDIVFDDVKYREPRRLRRPDRDPTRACIAYGLPQPGELAIFLDHGPADAIERHALSDTSVELGGILLGWECVDDQTKEPFVWVTQMLEARHYESTQASFTYTHDAWEEITRERERLFPDLDIVGWYHTHPDFGIFLSGHDLFIHEHFFAQPLQVAYVVDPIRQTRGCFQWREGQVRPVGGFWLTSPRAERPELASFVNDLENLPTAGVGGDGTRLGGLTPRLEAQLIDMLNRGQQMSGAHHGPHAGGVSYPASPGLATASSLLIGLMGLVMGMSLLWLLGLSRDVQDQTASLREVRAATAALAKAAEMEVDPNQTARVSAKEQALDALLQAVKVPASGGLDSEPVLAAYSRATAERDEAKRQAEAVTTEKAALTDMATRLRADLTTAQRALAKAQGGHDEVIEAQKARLAELEATTQAQDKILTESHAGTLNQKYNYAWSAAVGLLVLCTLLGLGLVWAILRRPLDTDPTDAPTRARDRA
jgi:proteasome lid subunit RPN8/RPN11